MKSLRVYDLKGITFLKMIDYTSKVCNTSATDAFLRNLSVKTAETGHKRTRKMTLKRMIKE